MSIRPSTVPLLDLGRQFESIRAEVLPALERICSTHQFVLGSEATALESELAAHIGAQATVACSSGSDALWLAMRALDVAPGRTALTSPFTFFASASSISHAGGRPIFADINPETLNLDPEAARKVVEQQPAGELAALVPVHLYGQCADMDGFTQLAADYKLAIVEDAAQAIGAKWRDKQAGALGSIGCFSFYPTKNLSAYGDAGATTTNDEELAARMRRLRNHGSDRRYYHEEIGWNTRMDGFQAAVVRIKLRRIDQWNERRRQIAALYDKLFLEAGLSDGREAAGSDKPVRLPKIDARATHVFHQYVIRSNRRDELLAYLRSRQIGCEIFYPLCLHQQPCFASLGYKTGDFPHAEKAAAEVLALPIYAELRDDEVEAVVAAIADFHKK